MGIFLYMRCDIRHNVHNAKYNYLFGEKMTKNTTSRLLSITMALLCFLASGTAAYAVALDGSWAGGGNPPAWFSQLGGTLGVGSTAVPGDCNNDCECNTTCESSSSSSSNWVPVATVGCAVDYGQYIMYRSDLKCVTYKSYCRKVNSSNTYMGQCWSFAGVVESNAQNSIKLYACADGYYGTCTDPTDFTTCECEGCPTYDEVAGKKGTSDGVSKAYIDNFYSYGSVGAETTIEDCYMKAGIEITDNTGTYKIKDTCYY